MRQSPYFLPWNAVHNIIPIRYYIMNCCYLSLKAVICVSELNHSVYIFNLYAMILPKMSSLCFKSCTIH